MCQSWFGACLVTQHWRDPGLSFTLGQMVPNSQRGEFAKQRCHPWCHFGAVLVPVLAAPPHWTGGPGLWSGCS